MKLVRLGLYLLLIVLIGGLGVWISLVQYWRTPPPQTIYAFLGNLGTFSISVAVMSFADFLLMASSGYNSTRALFLLVWMAVAVVASATALVLQVPLMLGVAIGASVMALTEWVIVNINNPSFDVAANPQVTLGGNLNTP